MDAERAFLRAQAAQAKAALRANAHGLAEDLLAPLQLRPMVRSHPWLGLGTATLLGAVLGSHLGRRAPAPAKDERARIVPAAALAVLQRARRFVTRSLQALLFAKLSTSTNVATPSTEPAPVAEPASPPLA